MLDTVRTFSALSEEFVELYMKYNPVQATLAGIHDYDHQLPNDSPDGIRQRTTWLRDLEQRLVASVPWKELPSEQRVDYALLRARIASMRADLEEIKYHARNPALYPATAMNGVYAVWARPFAPLEERKEAILDRLLAVPDYLKAARDNLLQVPDTYLGIAAEVNSSGPGFVDEVVQSLRRAFPGEAERIEHAGSRARLGFVQFQDFIDRDLDAKIGGGFAIGERWMNFKLEREHLLGLDCAALEAQGREHVARVRGRLDEEAKKLDPARGWKELIAESRKRHPEPGRLKEAYAAEIERARRFTVENRIAPLPAGEKLQVADTPAFDRITVPYASYLPPGVLSEDHTGYLYVTPVDPKRRKEEQEQQLQGHNYGALPLTVAHEVFPGHHLQLSLARSGGSRLRRISQSPLFAEGWALYAEELMVEHGFAVDPLTRLHQLRNLLWRACRVVIDVGIHTERMTFMQAVDYLVEQAMLERVNALAEVRRYTLEPTQPMSYLVGMLEIVALRDEAQRRLGTRFNLYDFHAALLAGGTIQPSLVREEIWERLS